MPPTSSTYSYSTDLTSKVKNAGNEAITNGMLFFGANYLGLESKIFMNNDSQLIASAKLGIYASAINTVGQEVRRMYPSLNFLK